MRLDRIGPQNLSPDRALQPLVIEGQVIPSVSTLARLPSTVEPLYNKEVLLHLSGWLILQGLS